MNCRPLFFAFLLANGSVWLAPSMAADRESCPVTRPSDRPFVPPAPYSARVGNDEFLYGTSALWTIVYPGWHVHSGGKLPFFRQGYDWVKERDPRLTVVARRLDGEAPLVWNGWANNGSIEGRGIAGMFMVTGIDIPAAGCWEIAAHYLESRGNIQTLTYTVWVEA
jgi:hypothetical protein